MNPYQIQDAWLKAKLLLAVAGDEWPASFDAQDVVALAQLPPLESDALAQALRTYPASAGSWCVRESNIIGQYVAAAITADGPACFPVWQRGNDVHFIECAHGRRGQMIARRMHTADDLHRFYHAREQEPPGLLTAWIAAKTPAEHQETPKVGRKPGKAPARLSEILEALEQYASASDQEFDRQAMPGPLGETFDERGSFHWLCASIDPVFRKSKSAFKKHRTGICAVQPYAQKSSFYRLALPHITPKLKIEQDA